MVEEVQSNGIEYYACSICKFVYEKIESAQQCEAYCNKFNACSLEIVKSAVGSLKNGTVKLFNKQKSGV